MILKTVYPFLIVCCHILFSVWDKTQFSVFYTNWPAWVIVRLGQIRYSPLRKTIHNISLTEDYLCSSRLLDFKLWLLLAYTLPKTVFWLAHFTSPDGMPSKEVLEIFESAQKSFGSKGLCWCGRLSWWQVCRSWVSDINSEFQSVKIRNCLFYLRAKIKALRKLWKT